MTQRTIQKDKKIIAEFTRWDGEKETMEIERAWIDDIVTAVEAQYTIINNQLGITIKGGAYCHVDIYEVANDTN